MTKITLQFVVTLPASVPAFGTTGRRRASERPTFTSARDFAAWLNHTTLESDLGEWRAWEDCTGNWEHIAIAFERPQNIGVIEGHLAYIMAGPMAMGGEWEPEADILIPGKRAGTAYALSFWGDSTKSRRDDVPWALEENLWPMLREGTPIRVTDKAGMGTKGTRKFGPIEGEFYLAFR